MHKSFSLVFSLIFLILLMTSSGCVTGFNGDQYKEYRRISDRQNAQTERLQQEAFRQKQEAYYDSQIR